MREQLLKKYQNMAAFEDVDLQAFDQQGLFDEDTPIHAACFLGDLDDVKLMIKYGASVAVKGDIGNTPLHYAVMNGHVGIVELLISSGADPNSENDYGDKPTDMLGKNAEAISPLLGK